MDRETGSLTELRGEFSVIKNHPHIITFPQEMSIFFIDFFSGYVKL
jgi:hypothetical protein